MLIQLNKILEDSSKSKDQKQPQIQQKEEANPQNKAPNSNIFPSNIIGNSQASNPVTQSTVLGSSGNKTQSTTAPAKQATTASSVIPQISKYEKRILI
jgi:hypothetical protein